MPDTKRAQRTTAVGERGSLTPQQVIAVHVGRRLLRLVYGARFSDLSPFRAIRRDVLDRLGMCDMTSGWNLEMLMRVAAADLPAQKIAVGQRRRVGGVSKVSGNLIVGINAAYSIAGTFVWLALQPTAPDTSLKARSPGSRHPGTARVSKTQGRRLQESRADWKALRHHVGDVTRMTIVTVFAATFT